MKGFILSVAFAEAWAASPVRDHLEGCLKFLLCYLTASTAVESPVHTVCFGRRQNPGTERGRNGQAGAVFCMRYVWLQVIRAVL